MGEFKKATSDFKETMAIDSEIKEVKETIDEIGDDLKDSMTFEAEPAGETEMDLQSTSSESDAPHTGNRPEKKQKDPNPMHDDVKAPFTVHLEELRKRLITCFIAVCVGFVMAYGFKEKLFHILVNPLVSVMEEGDTLVFTGLPEAFFTYLKVSFLTGLMLAAPVIIYQFWMFIAPGLYKKRTAADDPHCDFVHPIFCRRVLVWLFSGFSHGL